MIDQDDLKSERTTLTLSRLLMRKLRKLAAKSGMKPNDYIAHILANLPDPGEGKGEK